MRRQDVELMAALVRKLGDLHDRALMAATRSGAARPNPGAVYALSPWWDGEVEKLASTWRLDDHTGDSLRGALGDVVEAINNSVVDAANGVAGGAARAVVDAIADSRRDAGVWARRAAVTQTTRNLAEGVIGGREAGRPGAWKVWRSVDDDRTRDDHRDLDGIRVPLQQPFQTGDGMIMYPGDPSAPARQTIGCRCEIEITGGAA